MLGGSGLGGGGWAIGTLLTLRDAGLRSGEHEDEVHYLEHADLLLYLKHG